METWRSAWLRANRDFYAVESPTGHFRTSAAYADILGPALLGLLLSHDLPERVQIIDIGGGDSSLLRAIRAEWASRGLDPDRLECTLVDLRADSAPGVRSVVADATSELAALCPEGISGLLIAHEWLDDVPCDVFTVDDARQRRLVLVDPQSGVEELGPSIADRACEVEFGVDPRTVSWLDAWWPLHEPGARAEVGLTRDDAWRNCIDIVRSGCAVMVDYTHTRSSRPFKGSLSAYRNGQRVAALPSGHANITAHVAVDALASLTPPASRRIRTQHDVLDLELPEDPLARLEMSGRLATLRDRHGLGSFTWLEHHTDGWVPHATIAP